MHADTRHVHADTCNFQCRVLKLACAAAVMPKEQVAQLGAGQALMHLASDAVRAAATSPFLEASGQVHGLPVAILCSLSLPV